MKVLVTGADGLLGSNLVRRLLKKDYSVRALIHPSSNSATLEGLRIEKFKGDILDISSLKKAIRGCKAVFHVAASTAMWPPLAPLITSINVKGTSNILKVSREEDVERFVHTGSASSFGYGTIDNPGTEETPYGYSNLRLAYFESKLEAQNMVLRHVKAGEIDAVIVNPTFMIGPYDSLPSSGKVIVKYLQLNKPIYPPGGRCFIHAGDAAEGMINALDKGRSGECYILGNSNMAMRELLTIIAEVAGAVPPKYKIPDKAMIAAGRLSSALAAMTNRKPELTYEIAKVSCVGSYYSAAKAVRELNLPQTPVEEAVYEAFCWLKDNGKL